MSRSCLTWIPVRGWCRFQPQFSSVLSSSNIKLYRAMIIQRWGGKELCSLFPNSHVIVYTMFIHVYYETHRIKIESKGWGYHSLQLCRTCIKLKKHNSVQRLGRDDDKSILRPHGLMITCMRSQWFRSAHEAVSDTIVCI